MKRKNITQNQKLLEAVRSGDITKAFVNKCGDCDFCCRAPAISSDDLTMKDRDLLGVVVKPACVACKHASKQGCAVYEQRPLICKNYACLYLLGQVDQRPDECGVAWTFQPTDTNGVLLMGHSLDAAKALTVPSNLEVIASALADDLVEFVVVRDDKTALCFMRKGIMFAAKIDQSDPEKMRILPNTEMRLRYSFER